MTVEPHSSQKVKFEYKPTHSESKKEKIGFLSNHSEHIWFQLEFKAEQPPPIKLPIINAEIGKEKEYILTFKNPLKNRSIKFNSKWIRAEKGEDLWAKKDLPDEKNLLKMQLATTNYRKWQIIPSSFEISARKQKKIRLVYLPDDIEKEDRIGVHFFSEDLGLFEYECYGKGCLPTVADTLVLQAPLNESFNFGVPFKNPFSEEVKVFFKLEQNANEPNLFSMKNTERHNMVIPGFEERKIPMVFQSNIFGKFDCTFIISIGENLKWVFPIRIETECDMTVKWGVGKVYTRSDQPIQQKLGFYLHGIIPPSVKSPISSKKEDLNPKMVFNKMARSKIEFNEFERLSVRENEKIDKLDISVLQPNKEKFLPESENNTFMVRESNKKFPKPSIMPDPKESMFSKYDSIMSFIKNPNDVQMNLGIQFDLL